MDAKTDESRDAVAGQVERSVRPVPTHAEDRAFWAFLVISQFWGAAGTGPFWWLLPIPWLVLAVATRWPYWSRQWREREWLFRDGADGGM